MTVLKWITKLKEQTKRRSILSSRFPFLLCTKTCSPRKILLVSQYYTFLDRSVPPVWFLQFFKISLLYLYLKYQNIKWFLVPNVKFPSNIQVSSLSDLKPDASVHTVNRGCNLEVLSWGNSPRTASLSCPFISDPSRTQNNLSCLIWHDQKGRLSILHGWSLPKGSFI